MNIAVVGSRGYVGTSLLKSFSELPFAKITSVTRDNFQQFSKSQFNKSFDVLIYAASPAGRLRAENDPSWDYQETVCKSKWFLDNYRFGLVILISTISVSLAPMSKYGLHRKEVEERVIGVGGRVVRLGPLYGGKPRNSTLQEIVDNKQVFFSSKTKYSYTNVNLVSKYLSEHFYNLPTIQEVGVCDSISLEEIANDIDSSSKFGDKLDHQEIRTCTISSKSTDVLTHVRSCILENSPVG